MFNAQIIEQLRKERGLSQQELAYEVIRAGDKVVKNTIDNWESGRTVPKANHLYSLSKVFNVSMDYFFSSDIHHKSGIKKRKGSRAA